MRDRYARLLRFLLWLSCACIGFGLLVLSVQIPVFLAVLALAIAFPMTRSAARYAWTHGTARLAGLSDLAGSHLLSEDGLILGTTAGIPRPSLRAGLFALWSKEIPAEPAVYTFLASVAGKLRRVPERMIRLRRFTHLATFAPTGRGKGVSVVIPNLLSYRHSCVVIDPKGENYAITAGHRRRKFAHRTFRLDPFGICGPGGDSFNPLQCIDDKAIDFLDQCRDLADMMVVRSGTEPDPHWNDSARVVLTAFIAYVCACETKPEKRTLDTVRDLVSSRHKFARAADIMQQVDSHHGVIRRLGHEISWYVERELGSVMSTVQRHTEFLDGPAIAGITATSSFDPMWLRDGRVTIYLCLPHDKLETMAPLMRLWIGMFLRVITRGTPSERNPVLFFLDEAAHLGKIKVLENAVTMMRGMGIRLWFVYQSIHQLNDCFGDKAKTIIDNIDTQQYFAFNNYEAAEEVSKRIGETTISVASHGSNSGWTRNTGGNSSAPGSTSGGTNASYAPGARRLYRAEELMVMPESTTLIFHRNLPVIKGGLVQYYNHPAFKNGGTGRQRALGVLAGADALSMLALGLLCVAAAVLCRPPAPQPEVDMDSFMMPWTSTYEPWPEATGRAVPPPVRNGRPSSNAAGRKPLYRSQRSYSPPLPGGRDSQ